MGDLGWDDRDWHHVVATFRNVNTGREDGSAAVYLDGRLRATMDGYQHSVTWDVEALSIGLGQRYVGGLDDLLILDRALAASTVEELFASQHPASEMWAIDSSVNR